MRLAGAGGCALVRGARGPLLSGRPRCGERCRSGLNASANGVDAPPDGIVMCQEDRFAARLQPTAPAGQVKARTRSVARAMAESKEALK